MALQEEFRHHQRKVDEYHTLLEIAGEDDHRRFNDIQRELDKEVFDIRDTNEYHRWLAWFHPISGSSRKGKEIKRDYDRLHRLATNQPTGEASPFIEPKVCLGILIHTPESRTRVTRDITMNIEKNFGVHLPLPLFTF